MGNTCCANERDLRNGEILEDNNGGKLRSRQKFDNQDDAAAFIQQSYRDKKNSSSGLKAPQIRDIEIVSAELPNDLKSLFPLLELEKRFPDKKSTTSIQNLLKKHGHFDFTETVYPGKNNKYTDKPISNEKGDQYCGQVDSKGRKQGRGLMITEDSYFEGYFNEDVYYGRGRLFVHPGDVYHGRLLFNKTR